MNPKVKKAILEAARGIADFPENFDSLLIKDCFPNEIDWDDFSSALCDIFDQNVMPDQLDIFWKRNNSFKEMADYILENI